ncbi:SPOR domain-containing protein [Dyadobacter subterraneus]|uniref:SPOR domain-containing protein n=1 Tax=Dyadobacter subterraneus TaxID=2773304 RepID=A0ABR9WP06_9BACT|nr:SPOR domain-containing protein [Dyadobacter subterraneus]MBE9466071.1 SPOR domain-containing protein [Dyadobacter subterraneus]
MLLKKKIILLAIPLAFLALSGCSKKTTANISSADYREDLTSVRPRFDYVEPVAEKKAESRPADNVYKTSDKPLYVNKRLQTVLDTLAQQNKAIRYISGYRIQLYVGNVRQEADNAKSYIYSSFPDLNPYVSYSQPTYRVKAGDFMYRSDAEQYLEQIRGQYSSAVILADRVEIKRSLMIRLPSE